MVKDIYPFPPFLSPWDQSCEECWIMDFWKKYLKGTEMGVHGPGWRSKYIYL